LYLERNDFDSIGEPERWRPTAGVVLDPRIQAGAPCVAGTRVPTVTISTLLLDQNPEDVAADFGISTEDVHAAAKFEERLARGLGLAA
jgi:uncharacterized protein (DUF433 family)